MMCVMLMCPACGGVVDVVPGTVTDRVSTRSRFIAICVECPMTSEVDMTASPTRLVDFGGLTSERMAQLLDRGWTTPLTISAHSFSSDRRES